MNEKEVKQQEQTKAKKATELTDHVQISELLSRFCSVIDDKRINVETMAATFTPDGRFMAPNGMMAVGP